MERACPLSPLDRFRDGELEGDSRAGNSERGRFAAAGLVSCQGGSSSTSICVSRVRVVGRVRRAKWRGQQGELDAVVAPIGLGRGRLEGEGNKGVTVRLDGCQLLGSGMSDQLDVVVTTVIDIDLQAIWLCKSTYYEDNYLVC